MAKNQNNNVAPATQKTDPGAKKDALATALAQIEKQFGKGAVMKLGDNASMQVDAISTGSLGLDLALGVGGVPRGRIIEVYGPESSGKTTLALHILAEAQKQGGQNETAAHKEERSADRQRIMNDGKSAAPEHGDGDKGQLLTAERQIRQAQHMKDSCIQGGGTIENKRAGRKHTRRVRSRAALWQCPGVLLHCVHEQRFLFFVCRYSAPS